MKKVKNLPRLLAFAGIALAVAAFIVNIPVYTFFIEWYDLEEILDVFFGELVYDVKVLLVSLILPGVLVLMNKEHGKKIAMVFAVIGVLALLGQGLGNVINAITNLAEIDNPFSEAAIGSNFLSGIIDLFRCFDLSERYIIPCLLVSLGSIFSALLFTVKNVLCVVGFGMIAFKKEKQEEIE